VSVVIINRLIILPSLLLALLACSTGDNQRGHYTLKLEVYVPPNYKDYNYPNGPIYTGYAVLSNNKTSLDLKIEIEKSDCTGDPPPLSWSTLIV